MFTRYLRPGLSLVFAMTLLVGVIYPFALAGVSKLVFARQAQGSLLYENGALIGSQLIGQNFTDPKYFWGRPSATTPLE